jgi:hypothetical protein
MSTTTSDSASPDRMQPAIASARVVIAVSLAMFPFGWPSTTLTQYAITLCLAAAMLALGVAQLPRTAARLDAIIAVAAVWTYPEDNRLLFGLVLLTMLEAAALLNGRWLLAIWLFDIRPRARGAVAAVRLERRQLPVQRQHRHRPVPR